MEPQTRQKWKLIKNLCVCSIFSLLIMTSGVPLDVLQSSVNIQSSMGTISLTVGIVVSMLAVLFLPSLLADVFGLKTLVATGGVSVSIYAIANMYPMWVTLVLGAVIEKTLTAIALSCNFALVSYFIEIYSELSSLSKEKLYSIIFGLMTLAQSTGTMFGNFIIYAINELEETDKVNVTRESCGPFFEDKTQVGSGNFKKLPQDYLYILYGTFAGIGLLASVIFFLLLDSPPKAAQSTNRLKLVFETFRVGITKNGLLLSVLDFHRGFWHGVLISDVVKAFNACLGGLELVGLGSTLFGVGGTVFSLIFSVVAKRWNRMVVFISCAILEMLIQGLFFGWDPCLFPNDKIFVLTSAFFFGGTFAGNAILCSTLHGYLFVEKKEASMAHSSFMENLGVSVSTLLSAVFVVRIKFIMLTAIMFASFIFYLCLEIPLSKRNKAHSEF